MKEIVFRRRLRMLRFLAMSTPLNIVVETLSKDFGCSKKTVYNDSGNMRKWAIGIEQNKQLVHALKARLELLNREALTLVMDACTATKDKFFKIGALNMALKITVEQFHIG
jgi:biotin operon repressor